MFCHKCGKEMAGAFCQHCGAQSISNIDTNMQSASQPTFSQPAMQNQKPRRKGVLIASSVVVIIAVFLVAIFVIEPLLGREDNGSNGNHPLPTPTNISISGGILSFTSPFPYRQIEIRFREGNNIRVMDITNGITWNGDNATFGVNFAAAALNIPSGVRQQVSVRVNQLGTHPETGNFQLLQSGWTAHRNWTR